MQNKPFDHTFPQPSDAIIDPNFIFHVDEDEIQRDQAANDFPETDFFFVRIDLPTGPPPGRDVLVK